MYYFYCYFIYCISNRFTNTDVLTVFLQLSRSSNSTIFTSSVRTKSIFDTKLYLIELFLCFDKTHLHTNIRLFLGLTLTTEMSLKPTITDLYYWCSLQYCQILPKNLLFKILAMHIIPLTIPPRPDTKKDSLDNHKLKQTTLGSQFTHNEHLFINMLKSLQEFSLQNQVMQQRSPTQPTLHPLLSFKITIFSWHKASSFTYPPH